MPDFDFDAFNHDYSENHEVQETAEEAVETIETVSVVEIEIETPAATNGSTEEVDKW
jgi:hypothetical protein